MKHIQLKDVMSSLRIVANETGYEVHNAAGTAKYDAWGYRREVNGIPEYFPDKITVEGGSISVGNGEFRFKDSTGQTRCVVGSLSDEREMKVGPINVELKLDTTDAQKALNEIEKQITGSKAFEALSGEKFINEALIGFSTAYAVSMSLGIEKNVEAIIQNALASQAEAKAERERMKAAMADCARQAASDAVAAIHKDFETRGSLRRSLGI